MSPEREPSRLRSASTGRCGGNGATKVGGWLIAWLAGVALALATAQGFAADSSRQRAQVRLIQVERTELDGKLAASLAALADECDGKNLAALATAIRQHRQPVDTWEQRINLLPTRVQGKVPLSLPAEERDCRIRLQQQLEEHAKKLYLLSRRALYQGGSPTLAYDLIREVAYHDPDHKPARQLLGFVQYGEEWVTPFAAKMLRDKQVWHERFGWLPKSHVERYEQGERFYNRTWITAAREAEIRRDFKHAWEVRTEHYLVKTNHSLERGVEIARKLEDYHDFFVQTFVAFFNSPDQLDKLFEGGSRDGRQRVMRDPYEVHYYRTREEYNQRLVKKIPQIEITNGLYYTTDRIAYFFDTADANNDATLYHEATHQLFYESSLRERRIAESAHFWIIEGIACYMESFQNENGRMVLGHPEYTRFVEARYRYLVDGYYVPLAQFCGMGMPEFQGVTTDIIRRNYSQASGLAHFFMNYEGGIYRDALIEHLAQLYREDAPRRGVASLAHLTGVEFAELDRQYGEYLKSLDDELKAEQQAAEP